MSPPLLGTEGDGQGSVCLGASPSSMDCIPPNNLGLKERNYLGLSDCSSVDIYAISSLPQKKNNLNLKATELRLGLPGSQSPEREREPELSMSSSAKHEEKPLFSFLPSKDGINSLPQKTTNISGNKRVFSDAVDGFSKLKDSAFTEGNWMFHGSESQSPQSAVLQGKFPVNVMLSSSRASTTQPGVMKEVPTQERASTTQPGVMKEVPTKERPHASTNGASNNNSSAPAFKAQVVGWPPVRSFRKNTLATTSKNNDEVDGKLGPGPLFVKVSMDGAPYLRKVDLRNYSAYQELSSAVEKMFSCFTLGQCGPHGGKEMLSETKLRYLLDGSEYVLTCEDKDGDWMLVGDVPWDMFINSCKRLKIMKSSDAIGLAPRAMEKSKNKK